MMIHARGETPPDGGWYRLIEGAEEIERQQWDAFEANFRKYHEATLPYRLLPETDEERALFAALDKAEAGITPAMQAEDFATAMAAMAALRAPIDAFFTAVQVNSDNQIVRRNRLNLLHRIRSICSGVADLTRIEG